MYQQGILGVDFMICNTDHQALSKSPVPIKLQLGATITEGLELVVNLKLANKRLLFVPKI